MLLSVENKQQMRLKLRLNLIVIQKSFQTCLFSTFFYDSYAFKDAVKRTLDKCSCDAGISNPPADSPDTPTS